MPIKLCKSCGRVYQKDMENCTHDKQRLEVDTLLKDNILKQRYKVTNLLGVGGMGAVYKATDTTLSRDCAIKITLPLEDHKGIERFKREAQLLCKISHNNIVTMYDYQINDDGTCFIIMEYVPGETLYSLLQRKSCITLEQSIQIIIQISKALSAAHKSNIVHRDLKPENIMIKSYNNQKIDLASLEEIEIKILDFGAAKWIDDRAITLTEEGSIIGTLTYMSPEQLEGSRDIDHRSDVYSFALIIYKILTGKLPFIGDNPMQIAVKRLLEDPIPINQLTSRQLIHKQIETALLKALARDPKDRTPTVKELVDTIVTVANTLQTTDIFNETTKEQDPFAPSEWKDVIHKTPKDKPPNFIWKKPST